MVKDCTILNIWLRFGSLNNHKKPYQTVLLALLMGDMIVVVVVVGLDPELGSDL